MTIKTYSPEDISISVFGRNLQNLADSMVKIAYSEDAFTYSVGGDGEGTRNKNPNRSGTIVVTLKGSSDDNLFLSGLAAGDYISKLGTFAVMVKDNNGTSLYTAAEAWIQKTADADFSKEVTDREWTIMCNKLVMVNGGNF